MVVTGSNLLGRGTESDSGGRVRGREERVIEGSRRGILGTRKSKIKM